MDTNVNLNNYQFSLLQKQLKNHRLLAKEEFEKKKQIDMFDGPLAFCKGTYYEYDSKGRIVSVFEKDQ